MENSKIYTFDRVVRLVITLLIITVIVLIINKLSDVLVPFAVAWVMSYIFYPIVIFFQKKLHIASRVLALVCALTVLLIITAGLLCIFIPLISNEIERFSAMLSLYTENYTLIPFIPEKWQSYIYNFFANIDIHLIFSNNTTQEIAGKILPTLWGVINGSLSFVLGLFVIFAVFLYFVFILLDYEKINTGFIAAIPPKFRSLVAEIINDVKLTTNRYFRGQALIALIVGILFAIGFSIVGLPLAIVIGLFIGILNLVPYLQVVGFVPVAFLALLKSLETGQNFWWLAFSVVIVFVVVQIIQDMFLVPKIMGKNLGLNPAIILLSLSIWSALLGLLGLIIALPLTTLLISYYKRFVLKEENSEKK
ncbi:MAG: AI-2E family transporter [Paludibacter sp.]|jgi:predicted PurR-regulated permease PerM|nr:AI-2E family transporter [Paludibacter sp.]